MQTADPRLVKKITCTLGYTRLHTAVEELSKLSGVTIRCGSNNDDWHVRDIPVVVWVKELPLGKALEALAFASHTQLTSSRMDDVITYRVSRSSRLEREIADYEQKKENAVVEGLKWDWDTAVKLKDVPDSAYKPGDDPKSQDDFAKMRLPEVIACVRATGAVLALLGPKRRDQVVNSDTYSLSWQDASPALQSALTELAKASADKDKAIFGSSTSPEGDSSQLSLSFSTTKDISRRSELDMHVGVSVSVGSTTYCYSHSSDLSWEGSDLARFVTGVDFGKRPTCPDMPVDNVLPADYVELTKVGDGSDYEPVRMKVDLKAPTGKQDLTSADALVELAKITGLSIVSEDFQSHLDVSAAPMFGNDRRVADVLRWSNQVPLNNDLIPIGARNWFVDERNDLILGRSIQWVLQHENLVPEKLVTDLTDKLNGDGVTLDDLMLAMDLSRGQLGAWFVSRELQPLSGMSFNLTNQTSTSWRKFYSELSNEQKALAGSEKGLPLNLVDPTDAFRSLDCSMTKRIVDDVYGSIDAINPGELRYFTWHVSRCQYGSSQNVMVPRVSVVTTNNNADTLKSIASLVDLHTWQISLNYDKGDTHTGSFSAVGPFPIFSPKRLAELQAQAQKAQPK